MIRNLADKAVQPFKRPHGDERGQTTTEYTAILVVAAGLAIAVGWFFLIPVVTSVLNGIGSSMLSLLD